MKIKAKFRSFVLLCVCAALAQAQDPAQLKEMFARAQQQNAQTLRQYTWKSRNEVRKDGVSKSMQVFLMSYDALGNLQKSQIGGSAPPSLPKGPIIGRIAEKKRDAFIETVNGLRTQVQQYSHLPSERMQAFLASATITPKLEQGVVLIQGGNVLQRGDAMTIWLDAKTRKQRRVEITMFYENNTVNAVSEFNELPAGPTYMARTVVNYPKEALQLLTENFDYEQAGVSSVSDAPPSTSVKAAASYGIVYGWNYYYVTVPWYSCCVYGGAAAANVYGGWGNVAYAGTKAAWANPNTGNVGHGAAFSGVNTATGTRYNGRGFTNTNVYTGTTASGIGGAAYNPYTGRSAFGQAGAVSNAYTGNAAAGARGASYNPNTGVVSGGAAGATYNAATGQVTADGRGFKYNTRTDTGVAVGNNNVYAGHDGEVYRYNKTDGLQQRTGDSWSLVNRPAEAQHIQNQQAARATEQQRWDSFRTAGGFNGNTGVVGSRVGAQGGGSFPRPGSGGFGGGGGLRGGGGRLRR